MDIIDGYQGTPAASDLSTAAGKSAVVSAANQANSSACRGPHTGSRVQEPVPYRVIGQRLSGLVPDRQELAA